MKTYNPFSLDGKTILVTGASSGIGRATAIECSKLGARVVITGRNEERLAETYSQLEGDGHMQIVADLCKQVDIDKLVSETPSLNGLVNNAGQNSLVTVNYIEQADLDKVYQTNVFAPILLTKGLLKKRKIAKGGHRLLYAYLRGGIRRTWHTSQCRPSWHHRNNAGHRSNPRRIDRQGQGTLCTPSLRETRRGGTLHHLPPFRCSCMGHWHFACD